jgi:PBP1b-binding outer membrane lipoprotein LpoB
LAILALAFSLAGCAQSANYTQNEQVEMVPQPSGQSTDWSLYEEMEGAH